jgi:2-C-methyl-D-erythritol 4-phosphate cytidylyltransferase
VARRRPIRVVAGGADRQQSVFNGLSAAGEEPDEVVIVHDGVRPFVTCRQITDCAAEAARSGACVIGVPVVDTLKSLDRKGCIRCTVERKGLWQAQTPQAFRYPLIRKAHESARQHGIPATDDALLVERLGVPISMLPGSRTNLKITTPEDLALARAMWGASVRSENGSTEWSEKP